MTDLTQLIIAIILTILPIFELRAGLPIAIDYALKSGISVSLIFLLIIIVNVLTIFFIFFFLDYLHGHFMKIKHYRKVFAYFLRRVRNKVDRVERKMGAYQFLALALFVAIPLPGTGAWTGCLISWVLGMKRKQSIASISLGVLIAGIIILALSLGFFSLV
ncbi:MAG: small multi-drug export protein [archaeon]